MEDSQLAVIAELVAKARRYATEDPEVALGQARKAAEAMCRFVHARELGDPGKTMLDAMLKALAAKKIIPPSVQLPFGTLQVYGNFGAHAQADARAVDAAPALAALAEVERWFYDDYAKVPRSAVSSPAIALPRRSRAVPIAIGVGVLGIAAIVVVPRLLAGDATPATPAAPPAPSVTATTAPVPAPAPEVVAVPIDAPLATETKAANGLTVTYRVLAKLPSELAFHLVKRGDKLPTESRVAIELEVSSAAHVFIAQRTRATGDVSVLFPDPRIPLANPVPANTWIELPTSGKGYRLNDRDLGTETVYLIASRAPLPDLSAAIAAPAKRAVADAIARVAAPARPDCRALSLDDDACLEQSRDLEVDAAAAGAPQPEITSAEPGRSIARSGSAGPRSAAEGRRGESIAPSPARVVRAANPDFVLVGFAFQHVAR